MIYDQIRAKVEKLHDYLVNIIKSLKIMSKNGRVFSQFGACYSNE